MQDNIIIETPRLLIRQITHDDLEGMYELDSDPEVHRFLGNQPHTSREQSVLMIDSLLKQYAELGIGRWAMIEKSSGEFMGWTGLKLIKEPINGRMDHYDLGYRLIRRFWGMGYATESAKASLDYGFNTFDVSHIYGIADIRNLASIHVLQKTGLKRKEVFEFYGRPHHWLEISREEWGGF